MIFLRRIFLFCLASSFLAGRARALDLQHVPLGPISPAPAQIKVDGNLDEWRGITGYTAKPLSQLVSSGGDPAITALLNADLMADFKSCYDADALYIAVNWHDTNPGMNTTAPGDAAHWSSGGEGFELHMLTDRLLHLACWPTDGGKSLAVMARYGDGAVWQDVSKSVTAAGAASSEGKGYAQELRIPWPAITTTGKPPADAKVEFAVDFAWNAMPASMVERVRKSFFSTMDEGRGVTANFVTETPAQVAAGYLPSPFEWGTWLLGQMPSGDEVVRAPDGSTSTTTLDVANAASPPSLDGSLNGWAPGLFQTASLFGAFWPDRFTCRIAAQSDADNLYLTAHFASPGPENWKAESTQQGFNGGDAFQIRLNQGDHKVNLCGWYDSGAGKAALTSDGVDLPSPFLLQQGARETFHRDATGGYIQQIALPWKLILGGAPVSNVPLKGTLQFWYADANPLFSFEATTTLQRQAALSVAYHMPADGELTLGLYGRDGRLLRWLAQDEYRYAGDNKEPWDGLDQWGNEAPAGSYMLKGLYHAPITTDYKVTVGNPGTPPWPTPDGKGDWMGDESDPQGVATDGKWVYLASPDAEKGFFIIGVDETGQRQWGIAGSPGSPRCVSLSVDGDYLYALYSGPGTLVNSRMFSGNTADALGRAHLLCYDKRTGKAARFTINTPRNVVATWPYRQDVHWLDDLRNDKSYSPATYGGHPRYAGADVGETTGALGMAAVGDKVYVSLFYDNKIIVVDAVTGKPTGAEIAVNAPAGLYAPDGHTLLAVSGRQIVKINLDTMTATPFITSGLSAPFGVTADKAGNIYVSDWGDSFQVKAFDASGKLLHAIGEAGGRPWVGKWDPNGLLVPRGIAVTDDGKLWVAEDDGSPPRVSVWNAGDGSIIRDYIGPTPYGGGTYFAIDPKDPTLVHAENATFKVDYEKKTYTPLAIDFRRANRNDPFMPFGHGSAWGGTQILYHGGHQYFITSNSGYGVEILEQKGDRYRAVAALGSRGLEPKNQPKNQPYRDGTEIDVFDSDLGGHHIYNGYFPDFFSEHTGVNYSWTDTNGDNLVEPDEMKWFTTVNAPYAEGTQPPLGVAWGGFAVAQDWTVYAIGWFRDKTALFRIPLEGWTPAGAPIYNIADAKAFGFDVRGDECQGIYVTRDNRIILCYNYEAGHNPDTFACYDTDGHRLWSIARPPKPWVEPSRLQFKHVHAQNAVYDFDVPKIGDVVGTWAWHGACRPYLIATDGLYVGTLLDYTLLGPKALWGESYTYYYQAPDGTPYVVNGANQAEHILQINGLTGDGLGRFTGSYELTDSAVKLAESMRQIPETVTAPKPVLAMTWLSKPPTIDGDLSDWNLNEGVTMDGGNGRTADVALGRDANNLYLAYKVHEPTSPLRNGGSDWQTLFTTGDCVDLMLQTDPKADPHRRNAVAGDERILFSVFQGQPIAVLYRPVVPGVTNPVRLSTASFDEIVKLDTAQVAIKRDAAGGFYTVEAKVPLDAIHLDPKIPEDLRGDVGVVFADESGQGRSQRLYYYNQHTQMVNDLPTEATLTPNEWGKIAMPLGPNLLQNGDFEDSSFVDSAADVDKGWYISAVRNGADATISTESPYSGHQSLLLESSVPVTYPPEAYDNPDNGVFAKSANGGKGDAAVEVRQHVAVTAGHQYSLRFEFRSQDYPQSSSRPGHPRGWASLGMRIEWFCPPPTPHNPDQRVPVSDMYNTGAGGAPTLDWYTVYNAHRMIIGPPTPYTAPDGAIAADLIFSMRNTFDALPKFFFDNVEFVDVTPRVAIN